MRIARWVVFLTSIGVFASLLSRYGSLPENIAGTLVGSPETELAKVTRELKQRDPRAAQSLAALQDDRQRRAIEAVLRAETRTPNGNPHRVAERIATSLDSTMDDNNADVARYRVAFLAGNSELARTKANREAFIISHATTVDAIGALRKIEGDNHGASDAALADFLNTMKRAELSPADYRPVADDPIGIMLFSDVTDQNLRQFYLTANEASNQPDWLKELIVASFQPEQRDGPPNENGASTGDNGTDDDVPEPLSVGDIVRVAYDNYPLVQQILADDLLLPESERRPPAVVVALFKDYGSLIRLATGPKANVPRSEIIDVIFANEDFVSSWKEDNGESEDSMLRLAAHFAYLQKSKPAVWREARYSPLALRLEKLVPAHANEVLEEYGPDDIASLLFAGYEGSIAKAAEAVVRFDEVAILVLQMYADETGGDNGLFHRTLRNPKVGVRIIPYVAAKGDEGLAQLEENIGWLDKYFDEDGRPREEIQWYEAIPIVGAPAKIVANWKNGHPNTWGEIGWAVVDVADVALMAATFGGSKVATESAKQAAKQAAKSTVIKSGRALAKPITRAAAQAARGALGRTLLRSGTALRHLGKTIGTGTKLTRAWQVFRHVLSITYRAFTAVFNRARQLGKAWSQVPPRVRRAVYGGLLAATLYVRVQVRTFPNLHLLGAELGSFVGKAVEALGETGAIMLAKAIDEAFGNPPRIVVGWLAFAAMCGACLAMAWYSCPWVRPRVKYA